jgi:hypothetical protein
MTNGMKNLLKLEEVGQFLFSIALFSQLDYSWWYFPACLLLPDFSMIGYFFGSRTGALIYNFFHHKLIAIVVMVIGYWYHNSVLVLIGIILLAHSSMDRILGYGLKYNDSFKNTHLGQIGKKEY